VAHLKPVQQLNWYTTYCCIC